MMTSSNPEPSSRTASIQKFAVRATLDQVRERGFCGITVITLSLAITFTRHDLIPFHLKKKNIYIYRIRNHLRTLFSEQKFLIMTMQQIIWHNYDTILYVRINKSNWVDELRNSISRKSTVQWATSAIRSYNNIKFCRLTRDYLLLSLEIMKVIIRCQ